MYKLELDKVYLCSTYNADFVPVYDPDGTVYNKGTQYGCLRAHKSLKHRLLILDRNLNANGNDPAVLRNKSKLDAFFLKDLLAQSNYSKYLSSEKLNKHLIIDGFKFNTSGLFDDEFVNDAKEMVWYVQVVFYIRPQHRQAVSQIYNNGTNVQLIRLTTNSRKSLGGSTLLSSRIKANKNSNKPHNKLNSLLGKDEFSTSSSSSRAGTTAFVKVVIPLIIAFIFLTFAAITIIYCKKEQIFRFVILTIIPFYCS